MTILMPIAADTQATGGDLLIFFFAVGFTIESHDLKPWALLFNVLKYSPQVRASRLNEASKASSIFQFKGNILVFMDQIVRIARKISLFFDFGHTLKQTELKVIKLWTTLVIEDANEFKTEIGKFVAARSLKPPRFYQLCCDLIGHSFRRSIPLSHLIKQPLWQSRFASDPVKQDQSLMSLLAFNLPGFKPSDVNKGKAIEDLVKQLKVSNAAQTQWMKEEKKRRSGKDKPSIDPPKIKKKQGGAYQHFLDKATHNDHPPMARGNGRGNGRAKSNTNGEQPNLSSFPRKLRIGAVKALKSLGIDTDEKEMFARKPCMFWNCTECRRSGDCTFNHNCALCDDKAHKMLQCPLWQNKTELKEFKKEFEL
eukprot:973473_1